MTSARCRLLPLVGLCALLWFPVPKLIALGLRPLSIETLTRQAEVVLHGRVLSKTCQQDIAGRIYTRVELDVLDVWKGAISGTPFPVVQGGGLLGERRSVVPGQAEYAVGEEVVLFLVRNERGEAITVGLLQG